MATQSTCQEKPAFQPWRGPRDALTGAPIDPTEAQVAIVQSPERIRPSRWAEEPARQDIRPLRLHIHQSEGELGGLLWSLFFQRYIAPVLPACIQDGDDELIEWWRIPYALERVERGFRELLAPQNAADAHAVAMAILRDRREPREVAQAFNHTEYWVGMKCRMAYMLAFRKATKPLRHARATAAAQADAQ